METTFESMLGAAAERSFQSDLIKHYASSPMGMSSIALTKGEISALAEKILLLPERGQALLFAKYCFGFSPRTADFFYEQPHSDHFVRYYTRLLTGSLGFTAPTVIAERSMKKACVLACKAYAPSEMASDTTAEATARQPDALQKSNRRKAGRWVRRMLIAVLISLLGISVVLATNPEFRDTLFTWARETFEKYTVFELKSSGEVQTDKAGLPRLDEYRLTYIPEHFRLTNKTEQPSLLEYEYASVKDENRIFFVMLNQPGAKLYFDTEGVSTTSIALDGAKGYSFEKDGRQYLLLQTPDCAITVYGNIDQDELLKIAQGLTAHRRPPGDRE